ncbi:MAG: ATP-binding protein, partial [Desulfobacterales bacterium]|nr:ATP-binding protein [Desulfobacterales bacterium]
MMSKKVKPTNIDIETICHPVAKALYRYHEETIPYVKIHRLIDGFEVLVKYTVSLLIVSAKVAETDENKEALNRLFASSITRPSLGHWVGYFRGLLVPSGESPEWRFLSDDPFSELSKVFRRVQEDINSFVPLRNYYGHGAVAREKKCTEDYKKFEARLKDLINAFMPALTLPLYSQRDDGWLLWQGLEGKGVTPLADSKEIESPFVFHNKKAISLFPIMFMSEEPAHLFYNSVRDLKKERIEFLDYESGEHHEDRGKVAPRFFVHFPQEDTGLTDPTALRRLDYLENFVGRHQELDRLIKFVTEREGGHYMLWGGPGVGKGALLSRFAEEVAAGSSVNGIEDVVEKAERLKNGIVFAYLLEQNDRDPVMFLRAAVFHFSRKLGIKVRIGTDAAKLKEELNSILNEASQRTKPLVLIIDGLDETMRGEVDSRGFISVLPSYMPNNCYIILSSRSVMETQRFWASVDREHKEDQTLSGISSEDVREMLCCELNKYNVFNHQSFVEHLYEASLGADNMRGNPLFVKLALKDIRDGRLSMEDSSGIPQGLLEMYRDFMNRIPEGSRDILYTVAAALRSVSPHQIAHILDRDMDRVMSDLLPVQEMLQENQETEDVEDYSIFHKSLTEFLQKERREKLRNFSVKYLDYCRRWRELSDAYQKAISDGAPDVTYHRYAASYTFHHFCDHLLDAIDVSDGNERRILIEKLIATIDSQEFRERVFEYCWNMAPIERGITGAQRLLSENDGEGKNLPVILRFSLYLTDEKDI